MSKKDKIPPFLVKYAANPGQHTRKAFHHIQQISHHNLAQSHDDPRHPLHTSIALLPEHIYKNRYSDILPYDATRVVLSPLPLLDDPEDDGTYINASHIRIHDSSYICAQGPVRETIADTWRAIWEQHVHGIVCLTKLWERNKEKCTQYWPKSLGDCLSWSREGLSVRLVEEIVVNQDMIIRKLRLTKSSDDLVTDHRDIVQVHYTGWPDHGVCAPETLLHIRQLVLSHIPTITSPTTPPLFVHCSAGCGRSGVYCAIDSLLRFTETHGEEYYSSNADWVEDTVLALRMQRRTMVQMEQQLKLCYDTLQYADSQ